MMMMFRGWTCGPVSSLRLVNGIFVDHVVEKKITLSYFTPVFSGYKTGQQALKGS